VHAAAKSLEVLGPLIWDPSRLAPTADTRVSGITSIQLPVGNISTTTSWGGNAALVDIKGQALRAQDLLAPFPEYRGLVRGKLNATFSVGWTGLREEDRVKSLWGTGAFVVTDGALPFFKFSRTPLEELKKIPLLSSALKTTEVDEHFTRLAGHFHVKGGTTQITGLSLRTLQFDLTSEDLSLDASKQLGGRALWMPHPLIMRTLALELLRDYTTGKTAIPLIVGGTVTSPTAKVDVSGLLARIKGPGKSRSKVGRLRLRRW